MDVLTLIGLTNPKEFLTALNNYMIETRKELDIINRKLDIIMEDRNEHVA